MTQYNNIHINLSNSQLDKIRLVQKMQKKGTLRLLLGMTGKNTDKTYFLHQLLLTDRQVLKLRKAFMYDSSANQNLSKTQISKIIQLVEFLVRFLGRLMKVDLPLIKNVTKPLV